MRVLVAIKEVALLADDFAIEGTTVPETDLRYELNEWDEYALEAAVRLGEREAEVEVVTVTVGPDRSEETIRKGIAKGADRAIRVWDDALSSRRILDPMTKARVLRPIVEEETPDLVLTGVQGGDDAFGATGTALAAMVGFEWAAVVNELALNSAAGSVSVHRELEGGVTELVDVELPAVLAIQTGINQPRYASLRGIRMAQRTPIDVRTLDDLGLDVASLGPAFELTSLAEPTSETETQYIDGDAAAAAATLADVLESLGVVEA